MSPPDPTWPSSAVSRNGLTKTVTIPAARQASVGRTKSAYTVRYRHRANV
jgi:hypothetical protein